MTSYDLDAYRRHAERFGTECVFETAMCDLSAVPLGRLSLHLQRIDPEWRPEPLDRSAFACQLIEAGVRRDRACEMAMVSARTVRRRAKVTQNGGQVANDPSDGLISRDEKRPNPAPPTLRPSPPDLATTRPQNGLQRVFPGQLALDLEEALTA